MAAVAENAIASSIHRPPPPAVAPAASKADAEYQRDVSKLVDLLSKLNPSAEEFFPNAKNNKFAGDGGDRKSDGRLSADAPDFVATNENSYNFALFNVGGKKDDDYQPNHGVLRRTGYRHGKIKMINERARSAERDENIRRTVYVSDLDQHVTEEKLAELFSNCGQVEDCRICGDPHSVLRFAFIEFSDEDGARAALNLGGTTLGYYNLRVLPSKTAILPVNPKFLPRSEDEKEMVVRTVYCTNIDKKVTQLDVKFFFEQLCGEVSRLRLLGDNVHSTKIAFVEFVRAESAILALNYSGMILRSLPIRVSPSKTPVRPRFTRSTSELN